MDGSVADSLLSSYDRERMFSFRAAALPVDDVGALCVRVVRLFVRACIRRCPGDGILRPAFGRLVVISVSRASFDKVTSR